MELILKITLPPPICNLPRFTPKTPENEPRNAMAYADDEAGALSAHTAGNRKRANEGGTR